MTFTNFPKRTFTSFLIAKITMEMISKKMSPDKGRYGPLPVSSDPEGQAVEDIENFDLTALDEELQRRRKKQGCVLVLVLFVCGLAAASSLGSSASNDETRPENPNLLKFHANCLIPGDKEFLLCDWGGDLKGFERCMEVDDSSSVSPDNNYFKGREEVGYERLYGNYVETLNSLDGGHDSIPFGREKMCEIFDENYPDIGLNGLAYGLLISVPSVNIRFDIGHLYGQWSVKRATTNARFENRKALDELMKVFEAVSSFSRFTHSCGYTGEEGYSFIHSSSWASAISLKTDDPTVIWETILALNEAYQEGGVPIDVFAHSLHGLGHGAMFIGSAFADDNNYKVIVEGDVCGPEGAYDEVSIDKMTRCLFTCRVTGVPVKPPCLHCNLLAMHALLAHLLAHPSSPFFNAASPTTTDCPF
jgi:hypothetical protein